MVKKILYLCLIYIILGLGACGFFSLSLFPAFLSQAVAYADLSKYIDSFVSGKGDDFYSHMCVLRNIPGDEYIFLLICIEHSDDKKVIVLDTSLDVKKEHESFKLGRLNMVDANEDFLIGEVIFDHVNLTAYTPANFGPDKHGFFDGTNNNILWIDWGSSPNDLQYERHLADWTPIPPILNPNIKTTGSFLLVKVAYDPDKVNLETTLFFHEDDTNFIEVVFIPAGDFPGGLTPPILDNYPTIQIEDFEPDRIHYTRDGIVVRDHDDRSKLYGFDGKVKKEFYNNYNGDWVEAYDIAGKYYYCFNEDDRIIYKCNTWW